MTYDKEYWFEEEFYDDIESWFSADIACCDECYDDFLKTWPFAYGANDAEFQKCGIPLDCFYDGSRLQANYTKEEFNEFIKMLDCPRCGAILKYNIWPYNLPFDTNAGTEEIINELASIAIRTPFLLLKHKFSQKIYDTIKSICDDSEPTQIKKTIFRARLLDQIEKPTLNDFDFPNAKYVKEGRYNHAGSPVLYLASDITTCFFEMRKQPICVAEVELNLPIKILDLTDPYSTTQDHSDELGILIYSALTSAKQDDNGWHKPKYIFSRFLTDCAKDAGFQAIKYPSTRMANENFNLVIIDSSISLKKAGSIVKYQNIDSLKAIRI